MKTPCLLFLLICFFLFQNFGALAQRKTASFSFINKSKVESTMERSSTSGERGIAYQKAFEIYEKLVEARGDFRFPPPGFDLSLDEKMGAYLESDGLSIGLEKKAFEVCMSFGPEKGEQAVAAILGHELIHYYEKHQWRRNFAKDYQQLQVARNLSNEIELDKIAQETQSDYLGGFLAYSAGYSVFTDLPELYQRIYDSYGLDEQTVGYPSLQERKTLAELSLERLMELVDIYDMANILTAMGRYGDARGFYKHILLQYQGREIYNNLGVLTVLEALKYADEARLKYRIPLELDLGFGRQTRDGFAKSERDSIRNALLREAITNFDNAIGMDRDYAPAYLNKACAFYLLGTEKDLERARFYASVETMEKAETKPEHFSETLLDAQILLALIDLNSGKEEAAARSLADLKEESPIADYNWKVLTKAELPSSNTGSGPEYEAIDGISIRKLFPYTLQHDPIWEEFLFGALQFNVWDDPEDLPGSRIFRYRPPVTAGDPDVFVHLTDEGYSGELMGGIKVGDTMEAFIEEYGAPTAVLGTPNGQILIYREILILVDGDQSVRRWAHYLEME